MLWSSLKQHLIWILTQWRPKLHFITKHVVTPTGRIFFFFLDENMVFRISFCFVTIHVISLDLFLPLLVSTLFNYMEITCKG
jgi:hypothetical protein